MPVLARTLEAAGLTTILITPMPYWAEKVGTPRTLAVEFPFGQTIGQANDVSQQRRVLLTALEVLTEAKSPGEIIHSPEKWPQPQREAYKYWQPATPSPVIKLLAPRFREMVRKNSGPIAQ